MRNRASRVGSSFESWLEEAGIKDEVMTAAIKAVAVHRFAKERPKSSEARAGSARVRKRTVPRTP
jgi:hypothetical protein